MVFWVSQKGSQCSLSEMYLAPNLTADLVIILKSCLDQYTVFDYKKTTTTQKPFV